MQKIIREVDAKRGIVQVTVADERWYLKSDTDPVSGLPVYRPKPSITWVAGFWPKGIEFYKWLAQKGWDESQAIKQAAGDKGSVVHLAIERILNGEEFRIDTKVPDKSRSTEQESYERDLTYEELVCVQSFVAWRAEIESDYEIETLAIEKTLISDELDCGGTLDWLVRLTPKEGANPLKLAGPTLFIIDFKTGQYIWREYELQQSAYRHMIENGENPIYEQNENGTDTGLLDVSGGIRTAILQLGYKKNKAGYKFTELPDAIDLFRLARQIWQREVGDSKAGFEVREFPIVLSPGKKAEQTPIETIDATDFPAPAEEEQPTSVPKRGKRAA